MRVQGLGLRFQLSGNGLTKVDKIHQNSPGSASSPYNRQQSAEVGSRRRNEEAMTRQARLVGLERFTTFGDLLKFLRRRSGLTQRELSIAVGYSHAQISRLELNQRMPDLATVAARFVPALDLADEPAAAARLMDLASAMQREETQTSGAAPFKGLRYFEEADAGLFFGREGLTARLVERLREAEAPRFLAVVGASGSGKSSLVRAGVVPALRQERGAGGWAIQVLTPTAHPLRALAAAGEGIERGGAAGGRVLMVVDQFEEVFTLCGDEAERRAFIDRLLEAAGAKGQATWVLAALRADFYAACAPYAELRQALAARQEYLGPMTATELRRAIEEPANHGGWELEAGLADLLLSDLGADGQQPPEPGSLPLLSHALLETWQRRRGRRLTISGYLAAGGVRGAIAETADAVYRDQLDAGQQAIARDIFLRLTQVGDEAGAAETRRRAALDELIPRGEGAAQAREVLTLLADARLITTDGEAVEVAHEALIREWPTLRDWLEADREGLRLHRHLTLAAEGWRQRGEDASELYRGARLEQALEWARPNGRALNEAEREFLEASRALAEREAAAREAQRERELEAARALAETERRAAGRLRRRALYLAAALIVALVMAGAALYFGEQARLSAERALAAGRVATARELAAAAVNNLEVDPERGILLALQAVDTTRASGEGVLPEAEAALHQALTASRVRLSLDDIGTRVLGAVYSPDGRRVAAIGDTGEVVVWAADTGERLLRMKGITAPSDAVGTHRIAYSPDGRRLVTGDSVLVKVWDAETGAELRALAGHTGEVWAVAVSPDGARIASGGADGTVRVWDTATGEALLALAGHAGPIETLAFSPDGARLATGADDQTLKVWDTATGALAHDVSDFASPIYGVAYSPDGRYLAADVRVWEAESMALVLELELGTGNLAFSPDSQRLAAVTGSAVTIWDVRTGRDLMTLAGHTDWANSVSFSPDGKRLASASMDGTVRIWDLGPGGEALALEAGGLRVAFSPDGARLATDGIDGTARVWDVETGGPLAALAGHGSGLWGVAWSGDGSRLATAGSDGTARVWAVQSQEAVLVLRGHGAGMEDDPELATIRAIAYSADGSRIATAGFDGTARIWEASTGRELQRLEGHGGLVVGVAFSPDGSRLATTGTEGDIILWDTTSGAALLSWHSHDGASPDVAFSPDGAWLATARSDAVARVWEAETGRLVLALEGHRAFIWGVAFSADGRRIATGSADGTARVWDATTGAALLALAGSRGDVTGVAFSPRSGDLAVASADGVVRVYVIDIDRLLALAQRRVTRGLTLGECQAFLHMVACPTTPAVP
jgi:WD40 repeat protein